MIILADISIIDHLLNFINKKMKSCKLNEILCVEIKDSPQLASYLLSLIFNFSSPAPPGIYILAVADIYACPAAALPFLLVAARKAEQNHQTSISDPARTCIHIFKIYIAENVRVIIMNHESWIMITITCNNCIACIYLVWCTFIS